MNDYLRKAIELTARQHIQTALNIYGIEGTEQVIKEAYTSPKIQKYMLDIFHKMLKGE